MKFMFRSVILTLTLVMFLVAGCSNLTDPSELSAIGSAGGFIRSDFGPTLSIPPLALSNAVKIEIQSKKITPPDSQLTALSTGVSVLPEKLVFEERQYPLLTIPLDASKISSGRTILEVEVYVQRDNKWEKFTRFAIQEDAAAVVLQLSKTGTYAAFIGPAKAIPEPIPSEPVKEPKSEAVKEPKSEAVKEPKSEAVKETVAESSVETTKEFVTETRTESPTETPTEVPTEPASESTSPDGGGGTTETKPDTPPSETKPETTPEKTSD